MVEDDEDDSSRSGRPHPPLFFDVELFSFLLFLDVGSLLVGLSSDLLSDAESVIGGGASGILNGVFHCESPTSSSSWDALVSFGCFAAVDDFPVTAFVFAFWIFALMIAFLRSPGVGGAEEGLPKSTFFFLVEDGLSNSLGIAMDFFLVAIGLDSYRFKLDGRGALPGLLTLTR